MLNYKKTVFIKSCSHPHQLPPDIGVEVAISGRSNSGKSTMLNALTGIKKLAKTSKTPGRTQLINFFEVSTNRYLVDLPGYGYAKVPIKVKMQWEKNITQYLTTRQGLRGLLLTMDIRHPLKPFDTQMLTWATYQGLPIHILLTKADKLSRGAALKALESVKFQLLDLDYNHSNYSNYSNHQSLNLSLISIQLFSAISKIGIEEVKLQLNKWFNTLS